MQHESLASGGWAKLSLAEQLGNVGSEVSRASLWQEKAQRGGRQMKRIGMLVLVVVLAAVVGTAQDKAAISVEKMPPSVVKTVPQAGDTEVDASLTEISVTFSKDMLTEDMWSWVQQSPKTFPERDKTKKIKYMDDGRTCVMPVTLEPGKTYIIWINSQKFNYFKDTQNNSAIPYLLVFETKK